MDVKVVGNNRDIFATNARLIRIDVDENELTYKVREDETDIVADAEVFLDVLRGIRVPACNDWIPVCNALKEKLYGYDFKRYHISLQKILMKADIVGTFTTDVGQHEIYTLQVLQLIEGQRIAISSGLASMGFGIPAAIGAYYESGKPSVCVCGDGGFLMNLQELQFVVREGIPVSIIVFNNFALGMIREFQTRNFEGNCVHSIESFGYSCPDIKKIADAFGLTYIRIENEEDIDNKELAFDRPQIIELIVDEPTELYPRFKRGEKVYDMVPELPGALYTELSRL